VTKSNSTATGSFELDGVMNVCTHKP
jgi:hypothetical protein